MLPLPLAAARDVVLLHSSGRDRSTLEVRIRNKFGKSFCNSFCLFFSVKFNVIFETNASTLVLA